MSSAPVRIFTIGVYGSSEDSFFSALLGVGIDLFLDVRARRGVRGSQYAYVNAKRLIDRLEHIGIRYTHVKDVAPSQDIRRLQGAADAAAGVIKRDRRVLSASFRVAYEQECLSSFDSRAFASAYLAFASKPVLFCVEREPEACHRSLLAARLSRDLKIPVEDLQP